MISAIEILHKDRHKAAPLTEEQWLNLCDLLVRVNALRMHYGKPLLVSSGYRPPNINSKVGGAPNSAHVACQAVDFHDKDGDLQRWILANEYLLKHLGLYMEDPKFTLGWVHLATRRPASGSHIFKP
jgi:uncharacterized protein YcbK (DUF882 family)